MRVCVLALDDPWLRSDGGTIRTRLLVQAISESGHDTSVAYLAEGESPPGLSDVALAPVRARPLGERPWTRPLRTVKKRVLPLPTMRGGMIGDLAERVRELQPDVLVVSQLRAAPYCEFVPDAALWLDQADVWSLFLEREIADRRGLSKITSRAQLRGIQQAERVWVDRAAAISAAGYGDSAYLTSLAQRPVQWLPTAVEPGARTRGGDGSPAAGFLGNFSFWPNRDAFEVIREVWAPALRRVGWRTVVAGIGSERLDGGGEIEIIGEVADVGELYSRIDVALAPIRLGGGVKVKIIEALMYQLPVIASAYSLAGFPPDLAAAIPRVDLADPDFGLLADGVPDAREAFALADGYFSLDAWSEKVKSTLDELSARP